MPHLFPNIKFLIESSVRKVMPTHRIGIYYHSAHYSYPEGFWELSTSHMLHELVSVRI